MIINEITPFFTRIYSAEIDGDYTFMIPKIMEMSKNVPSDSISNIDGWHSNKFGYNDNEFIQPLIDTIAGYLTPVYERMGLETPQLNNYWFNVNGKHSYNTSHNHPGSYYSVVFYLKTPTNCGKITFVRPDSQDDFLINKKVTENNWGVYWMDVSVNKLLMFPSYLHHHVEPNRTVDEDDARISIAFNFN